MAQWVINTALSVRIDMLTEPEFQLGLDNKHRFMKEYFIKTGTKLL
jgi:hypothetical protein